MNDLHTAAHYCHHHRPSDARCVLQRIACRRLVWLAPIPLLTTTDDVIMVFQSIWPPAYLSVLRHHFGRQVADHMPVSARSIALSCPAMQHGHGRDAVGRASKRALLTRLQAASSCFS